MVRASLQDSWEGGGGPRTAPARYWLARSVLGYLWEGRPFRAREHRSGARSACEHSVPFLQVGALLQRGFPSQADPSPSPARATTPKRSPGYRRRAPAKRQTLGHGALLIPSPEGTICSVVDPKGDFLASAGDAHRIVPSDSTQGAGSPRTTGSAALSGLGKERTGLHGAPRRLETIEMGILF